MKEMKYLRLIAFSLFLFVLMVALVAMIASGYFSGEMPAFGRNNHGSHALTSDPQGYWLNLIVWAGFIIFFIGVSIHEIVKSIKEIRNS